MSEIIEFLTNPNQIKLRVIIIAILCVCVFQMSLPFCHLFVADQSLNIECLFEFMKKFIFLLEEKQTLRK